MRFSAPYNWCDGDCARCPLIDECPLAKREAGRRWAHEARGRDPDDPDVRLRDVANTLSTAVKMLEREARKRGIDLAVREPEPPPRLDLARIRRASMDHAKALHELGSSLDDAVAEHSSLAQTLARATALIAAKVARLCVGDSEIWECDSVPNLLLLERVDAETYAAVTASVERLEPARVRAYADTRERLHALLAEWFRSITNSERDEMDRMIDEDRAPSPFACMRDP